MTTVVNDTGSCEQDAPFQAGSEYNALRTEIEALRADLARMRDELSREIRTEGLVIVDPSDGRAIAWTERRSGSIELVLQWQPGEGEAVHLHSGVECGGEAGVDITAGGDVIGALRSLQQDRGPGVMARTAALVCGGHEVRTNRGAMTVDPMPYLFCDPTDGVTVRRAHDEVAGVVRFEVPMGGAR